MKLNDVINVLVDCKAVTNDQILLAEIDSAIDALKQPCWLFAPDWANWVAMDKNEMWFWYELKPTRQHGLLENCYRPKGKCKAALPELFQPCIDWKNSLMERPK